MKQVWIILAGAPAIMFTFFGLAWWVVPDLAAEQLGMELLGETALSSQIGDLAAFFLTAGGSTIVGLATRSGMWLFPAIMLIGFAVIGRLVAWLTHGASLPIQILAFEVTVLIILTLTARALLRRPTAADDQD